MVVVCLCLVGVGGGLYICLWGGGVGVKLMSVCSKISFISKTFVVIKVLFLSFIWV